MDSQKKRLSAEVEALAGDLYAVSEFLYKNPEIGYQEFKACEFLSQFLEKQGFEVVRGVGGVKTAFLARPSGRPRKTGRLSPSLLNTTPCPEWDTAVDIT
jgi:metal-dependent amidase/aminoacylase/carboxypeptidase family protein